jgi:FkbM family methyltransferase
MHKIILDIGANSGYFSKYLLEKSNIFKVIAFEPNRKFSADFEALKLEYNERFDYEFKAVASTNSYAKFYHMSDPNQQISSTLIPNKKGEWNEYTKKNHLSQISSSIVETCNGKYIKFFFGPKIYMAKIDTQGTDISVARNLLSNLQIDFILLEFQATSIKSEFSYKAQKNSLNDLTQIIKDFNLYTVKLLPNSINGSEYNILLSRKETLTKSDKDFINLLLQSPVLNITSKILFIGDVKRKIFFNFLIRFILKATRH